MISLFVALVLSIHVYGAVPALAGSDTSLKLTSSQASSTQRVPPSFFQRALMMSLKNQYGIPDVALSVNILNPKTSVEVPKGHITLQVPPDSLNGRLGRRAYRVGLSVNEEFQQMVNVVADIKAHTPVIVPVRFIKVHETIKEADIRMMNYSIPTLTKDYVTNPERVVGKKAGRLLAPNMPIQTKFVKEPAAVHKGDRVVIEARHGGLLVQTVGIAKEAGAPGKVITVQNQQSKREVMGRVLEAGLVEVIY